MARLTIDRFSCIKQANLELNRFTILIGEQASGKSVISKLFYFFNDVIFTEIFNEQDGNNIDGFIDHVDAEFKAWFPPSAWGNAKFEITFKTGPVEIKIRRKITRSKDKSTIQVEISKDFVDLYESYKLSLLELEEKVEKIKEDSFLQRFELDYSVRREYIAKLKQLAGSDYTGSQLYIPAGRSFFTSLGKAVSAFGKSGMLDPITVRFGEFYIAVKQKLSGKTLFYPQPKVDIELKTVMQKFFGGNIIFKKDEEFVETVDGRIIPVAYLSSGQQELLPLWTAVEDAVNFRNNEYCIYIEEPEAHIFPSTQSQLIEYISAFLIKKNEGCKILITTHSPYVLAKVNNLIKAGIVGSKRKSSAKVSEIINRNAWLKPNSVNGYSVNNGVVQSIMDEDGLINADFLDSVSSIISEEYMNLVEIECGTR